MRLIPDIGNESSLIIIEIQVQEITQKYKQTKEASSMGTRVLTNKRINYHAIDRVWMTQCLIGAVAYNTKYSNRYINKYSRMLLMHSN